MWKTKEGSTAQLVQLCIGYFVFYVVTGVTVKYFTGSADAGFPGMTDIQYLLYSTASSSLAVLAVVLALRWYRLHSLRLTELAGLRFPSELLYIVPSGICTAVVIPTTTLMYMLPISVMVAMVIMRGSVIVISRVVDALQIRQRLLDRKVYWEENVAVLFAIGAVCVNIFFAAEGDFEFLHSVAAMSILGSYIVAYSIRIYVMNYYKNTRARAKMYDNRAFFGVEQLAASFTLAAVALLLFNWGSISGRADGVLAGFHSAFLTPHRDWLAAAVSGTAFGAVAFFSVFLFMFKGRTATFAGLVNRLTSLIAGTVATLLFHYVFGGRMPSSREWGSLLLVFIAIGFLTQSERKRVAELKVSKEL